MVRLDSGTTGHQECGVLSTGREASVGAAAKVEDVECGAGDGVEDDETTDMSSAPSSNP